MINAVKTYPYLDNRPGLKTTSSISRLPALRPGRRSTGIHGGLPRALLALACAVFAVGVYAQDAERVGPKEPGDTGIITDGDRPGRPGQVRPQQDIPVEEGDREELVSSLEGLVFVPSQEQIDPEGVTGVSGVEVLTEDVLATDAFRPVAERYLGRSVTLRLLKELNRDVVAFYAENGYPVVNVVTPEQDISNGVVQLVVLKGRLGDVRAEGNRHFSDDLLTSQFKVETGEIIREDRVWPHVKWLNRNPFRRVDLVYTPGAQTGETDVVLRTQDRFPLRGYAGYEDSGNQQTDFDRIVAGFNWGNAFGLDHQLNYQFTFNHNPEFYKAHSASYVAPLPWRHQLTVFGSYAKTRAIPGTLPGGASELNLEGKSGQVSGRYTIPFPEINDYSHEMAIGYDYKSTNNNLEFGGLEVLDTTADISQFLLNYSASLPDKWGRTTFSTELVYSPGGMITNNRDESFEALQEFASAKYAYARIEARRIQRLPHDFSLMLSGKGQISSTNLLGSEQLAGGGYNSVRGYDYRVTNGDEGFVGTMELRSPSFSLLKALDQETGLRDELQFLVFLDYATLYQNRAAPDDLHHRILASAGPGIRYSIEPYFTLRFDWGWQLNDPEVGRELDRGKAYRAHLGIILSY